MIDYSRMMECLSKNSKTFYENKYHYKPEDVLEFINKLQKGDIKETPDILWLKEHINEFILYCIEGKTYADIGDAYNLTREPIRRHVAKCCRIIAWYIKHDYDVAAGEYSLSNIIQERKFQATGNIIHRGYTPEPIPFDPMSVSPDDEIDWKEFKLSPRIANAFRRYPYYTKSDKENLHCPGGCWYNEKPRKVKTYLDLKIYLHELDNDNIFHDIRGLGATSMTALRVWFKQFDPMFEAAFKNHNKEGIHYITEDQLCEIVHTVDKLIGMSIPRLKVYDMTIKDDMIKALSSIGIEIEKDYYTFMKSIR